MPDPVSPADPTATPAPAEGAGAPSVPAPDNPASASPPPADEPAASDVPASDSGAEGRTGDLVIPIAEITEQASFYPVEVNGTWLEVIAVKAPDGTLRTAFNTCQICYDSGQGYYKQEGNALVCQNCGSLFTMDRVEKAQGGCNPVPIYANYKTVDEENITISGAFLEEATVIFQNWKSS
ncbi:MAG: Fe-S-containing protein [Oscillospiraceae bacterium]|nr:Fe-S-containing protein [Oscillospiraceae bacterium]